MTRYVEEYKLELALPHVSIKESHIWALISEHVESETEHCIF